MRIHHILLLYAATLLLAGAAAQVTPIQNPHPIFNNASGTACAGCSLYSYAAGSTTPQATYTDSTGATQNTNPVIMGADGGPLTSSGSSGAIWLGTSAYKLVLIDTAGNTVFTVDNVTGGGAFPCGPAGAIQIANTAVTGFSCDPLITINTSAHAINVGSLPTAHVTVGPVGVPTSWIFDLTTPATALASIGGSTTNPGTLNQLAYYPSAGNIVSGTTVIPAGITTTTQSPGDNSTKLADTAYVALPGAINPTSVQIGTGVAMTGNQGTGAAVQHSTGSTTSGNLAKFDANGNTVDSGIPASQTVTQSANLAGSRTAGTTYQNTGTLPIYVTGFMVTGGSSTGAVSCLDGPSSPPSNTVYSNESTGTISGGPAGFSCLIPPNFYYEVTVSGTVGATPTSWYETSF